MKIGFIGLGNMGGPMAKNLAAAGNEVLGYDISRTTISGVVLTNSICKVVKNMDFIITMLPDGKSLLDVYKQVIKFAKKNAILIDCSTVDIQSALKAASIAKSAGLRPIDAPVSGGVIGAEAGSLTFMVGGRKRAFEIALPLFNIMGQKAILCGQNGSGQAVKICNNMVLGISMIGVCEAFALADQLNLNRQKMFDVVSTSSGYCWSLNNYCPAPGVGPKSPADNNYKPGFSTELMLKDLKLSQEAASRENVFTPLGAHAYKIFSDFIESGGEGKDFSAVISFLNKQ